MEDIILKKDFLVEIESETVMQLIQCYENSPIYSEVLKEYEELKPLVLERLDCRAILCFTMIESEYSSVLPLGSPVLYVITTIGEKIEELSRQLFAEDEYLKGMLVDAIGDAYLFGMDEEIKTWIKRECIKRGFGVGHRYEAPMNIPMEAQKIAYESAKANRNLGILITSGYMFHPVKTICQVLALTDDTKLFHLEHDCRECNNMNCSVRRVPEVTVTVVTLEGEVNLSCKEKEELLTTLIKEGMILSTVCNGNGTCGKCKIQLIDGELDITSFDERYFSEDELVKGWRLACKARPNKNCKIKIVQNKESGFDILLGYREDNSFIEKVENEEYFFAVDIGTTTIVMSLIGNRSKLTLDTYAAVNGQRLYGADVISRMQASINGKSQELSRSICKDLVTGFEKLITRNKLSVDLIKEIVISGNTTMGHLLLGFDCSKLGVSPFTPVEIGFIKRPFNQVFQSTYMDAMVTLLPGISAFVGADIVSGLYFCGFHQTDKINVLIDLGTNGEMAIGNRNKIITTSTAAGPAFEGGNISWGTGSINGAICNVEIIGNKSKIYTIGNKEPVGICGTGIIETVAEMVKNEIIDETGLMIEEYFEAGFPLAQTPEGEAILVTQKDIRELQLAKSAIRAGVETLCLRFGVSYDQIDRVYIAGGFGVKMDQEKSIIIGMLPAEFSGKIEAVGNSSLGGAVKYLQEETSNAYLQQIVNISSEINLANDLVFNDFYMKYMFFGDIE